MRSARRSTRRRWIRYNGDAPGRFVFGKYFLDQVVFCHDHRAARRQRNEIVNDMQKRNRLGQEMAQIRQFVDIGCAAMPPGNSCAGRPSANRGQKFPSARLPVPVANPGAENPGSRQFQRDRERVGPCSDNGPPSFANDRASRNQSRFSCARPAFPTLNQAHRARAEEGLQAETKERGGGQNPRLEDAKEQRLQNRAARA